MSTTEHSGLLAYHTVSLDEQFQVSSSPRNNKQQCTLLRLPDPHDDSTMILQNARYSVTSLTPQVCCHRNLKSHPFIGKTLTSETFKLTKLSQPVICCKYFQSRTYQPDQIQYKLLIIHSFNSLFHLKLCTIYKQHICKQILEADSTVLVYLSATSS